ncbi:MAG: hypothetical protein ABI068_09265, partial [Ktedonobacterales bacterium]
GGGYGGGRDSGGGRDNGGYGGGDRYGSDRPRRDYNANSSGGQYNDRPRRDDFGGGSSLGSRGADRGGFGPSGSYITESSFQPAEEDAGYDRRNQGRERDRVRRERDEW